jgi:hypothetical protein
MRRILLVLTAAMVMALVTVAMALPAFASHGGPHGGEGVHCTVEDEQTATCNGGYGFGGGGGTSGGSGQHFTQDSTPPEGEPAVVFAGGGGQGSPGDPVSSGGGGGRCELATVDADGSTIECVGSGDPYDHPPSGTQ